MSWFAPSSGASPWPPPSSYLTPPKQPGSSTSYRLSACPPGVVPIGISIASRPSGAGELALSSPLPMRNMLSFIASGGVAGRVYTIFILTNGDDGNEYQSLAFLSMFSGLEADPPPEPPSDAFGSAVIWGTILTQFTPVAPPGGNLTLTLGGASQSLFSTSIQNGAIVSNPSSATYQGIGSSESIFYDLAGGSATVGGGGGSIELPPGESVTLLGNSNVITWTAPTTGHKISAVQW